jgi:hypothetical protein
LDEGQKFVNLSSWGLATRYAYLYSLKRIKYNSLILSLAVIIALVIFFQLHLNPQQIVFSWFGGRSSRNLYHLLGHNQKLAEHD